MNSAYLFPDARTNEKLERAGAAAAWYWACGIMFCREREAKRRERGEPIDIIPRANSLGLFADTKAKDYVSKLVEFDLWHEVDGGYKIHDYEKTYSGLLAGAQLASAGPADIQLAQPAGHQPTPADIPQPTPSQLGGMRRALSSRTPAGTFQPTPADIQPTTGQLALVSPTPPSDPDQSQKLGSERDPESAESKGSRRGRARATALPEWFGLTTEHVAFGAAKNWPEWWMRNRCEQFCDLAAAKGWTYRDWKLALYTFLRNEITYGRGPAAMARFQGSGAPLISGGGNQPGVRAADQLGKQLERIQAMTPPTNGKVLP